MNLPTPHVRTLRDRQSHLGWDNAFEPVPVATPGATAGFRAIDVPGGQLTLSQ